MSLLQPYLLPSLPRAKASAISCAFLIAPRLLPTPWAVFSLPPDLPSTTAAIDSAHSLADRPRATSACASQRSVPLGQRIATAAHTHGTREGHGPYWGDRCLVGDLLGLLVAAQQQGRSGRDGPCQRREGLSAARNGQQCQFQSANPRTRSCWVRPPNLGVRADVDDLDDEVEVRVVEGELLQLLLRRFLGSRLDRLVRLRGVSASSAQEPGSARATTAASEVADTHAPPRSAS